MRSSVPPRDGGGSRGAPVAAAPHGDGGGGTGRSAAARAAPLAAALAAAEAEQGASLQLSLLPLRFRSDVVEGLFLSTRVAALSGGYDRIAFAFHAALNIPAAGELIRYPACSRLLVGVFAAIAAHGARARAQQRRIGSSPLLPPFPQRRAPPTLSSADLRERRRCRAAGHAARGVRSPADALHRAVHGAQRAGVPHRPAGACARTAGAAPHGIAIEMAFAAGTLPPTPRTQPIARNPQPASPLPPDPCTRPPNRQRRTRA